MKITKTQLKQIIKEEIKSVLEEDEQSFWMFKVIGNRNIKVPKAEAPTPEAAVGWMILHYLNNPSASDGEKKMIAKIAEDFFDVWDMSTSPPEKHKMIRATDEFINQNMALLDKYDPQ
jgi:hypothetical protein